MNRKALLLPLLLISMTATAKTAHHLDQQMTSEEYRQLFAQLEKQPGFLQREKDDSLYTILALGKRTLDWLILINEHRDADHQIKISTPDTMPAYPIDHPGYSNRTIIKDRFDKFVKELPPKMKQVIFGNDPLPTSPLVDDEVFTTHLRLLGQIYESAARWLLQEPEIENYKMLAHADIRGYYFLQQEEDLAAKLRAWDTLSKDTQEKYSKWLKGECYNVVINTADYCDKSFWTAVHSNTLDEFHRHYATLAKKVYDEYFDLQNPRPEAIWNEQSLNVMTMPFTQPERMDVGDWFKKNVEDEFHFNDWKLNIQFSNQEKLVKLVFEPGVTPHVDELGGDTIVMDGNVPLNDYSFSWAIRHEFGHVLGLPDCYVEFYDEKEGVMINYQIDTTNLMCSRRGHLQAQHYEQLKKNYYR